MLGDYNDDMTISLEDVDQFIYNWNEKNYSYELGPFEGEMPHVYVEPDGNYNFHDMGAFALMWNWYFSNNQISFAHYEDQGIPLILETAHDSIYVSIPEALSSYQIQLKYNPSRFSIGAISNKNEGLFLSHNTSEIGVFTVMAQPGKSSVAIPIDIIGRHADITISYKGISKEGELVGQMTESIMIENIPDEFVLYENYPNPFNPKTNIDYGLPKEAHVSLIIFDILGREIITLADGVEEPGYKSISWNGTDTFGRNVGAGMYFYLLQAGDFRKVNKMILLK